MTDLRSTISTRTPSPARSVLDPPCSQHTRSKTQIQTVGGRAVVVAPDSRSRDLVADVAREQRGHISYAQLRAVGLTANQVRTLQAHGTLHRVHYGVYQVGHTAPVPLGAETAAMLAFGGRAVLSHLSALRLYCLLPPDQGAAIDATVAAGGSAYQRTGIQVHSSRTLTDRQIRSVAGLPVTVPERALLDSTPLLTKRELGRALDEAITRRVVSYTKVADLVSRHQGHPGWGRLTSLIENRHFPTVTESEAEQRFLALMLDAGLPTPRTQVDLYGFRVDAYWPEARFVVEIDGLQWHNRTKKSFERDRRKQQVLQEHEIEVARTTWEQVTEEGLQLVAHVASRLALRTTEASL
jgi:very-short-patch-repair endonuclease